MLRFAKLNHYFVEFEIELAETLAFVIDSSRSRWLNSYYVLRSFVSVNRDQKAQLGWAAVYLVCALITALPYRKVSASWTSTLNSVSITCSNKTTTCGLTDHYLTVYSMIWAEFIENFLTDPWLTIFQWSAGVFRYVARYVSLGGLISRVNQIRHFVLPKLQPIGYRVLIVLWRFRREVDRYTQEYSNLSASSEFAPGVYKPFPRSWRFFINSALYCDYPAH